MNANNNKPVTSPESSGDDDSDDEEEPKDTHDQVCNEDFLMFINFVKQVFIRDPYYFYICLLIIKSLSQFGKLA